MNNTEWVTNMTNINNRFFNGEFFQAPIDIYILALGNWFYVLLLFLGLFLVYNKTDDFGTTLTTGLVVAAGVFFDASTTAILPVQVYFAMQILIAFGIASILYIFFHGLRR